MGSGHGVAYMYLYVHVCVCVCACVFICTYRPMAGGMVPAGALRSGYMGADPGIETTDGKMEVRFWSLAFQQVCVCVCVCVCVYFIYIYI